MIIYDDDEDDEEFYKENKDFEIKVPRPTSGTHTAAVGYTKFFIELDKGGKEFVKSMNEVMARWRD